MATIVLMWGILLRPILERARERATVDQEVHAGDVARLRAAEIRARIAELGRVAESSGGNRFQPLLRGLRLRDAGRLREAGEGLARAVGEERARQQVVDRHVVLRRLARHAGDEAG